MQCLGGSSLDLAAEFAHLKISDETASTRVGSVPVAALTAAFNDAIFEAVNTYRLVKHLPSTILLGTGPDKVNGGSKVAPTKTGYIGSMQSSLAVAAQLLRNKHTDDASMILWETFMPTAIPPQLKILNCISSR